MAGFPPRKSALERLTVAKDLSKEKKLVSAKMRYVDLAEDGEIRSLIPAHMKCQSTLDMSLDWELKDEQSYTSVNP